MIIKKLNGLFHKHSRWLFGGFTIVIIVSFLGFLTPGKFGCDFSDPEARRVGDAFGKPVTIGDLRNISRNVQIVDRMMTGNVRDIDVQSLFGPYCMLRVAERLGVVASDKEVAEMLQQMSPLKKGGKFSMELYNETLEGFRKNGISATEVNDAVRMMVVLNKLGQEISAGVVVAPGEVESFYRRLYGKYQIKGIAYQATDFKAKVAKDGNKIKEYFEKNRSQYVIPAQVSALVVQFSYKDFAGDALKLASEEELQKFYQTNVTQFFDKDGKPQPYAKVSGEVKLKFVEERSRELATRRAYDFATIAYESVGEADHKEKVFRELADKSGLVMVETGRINADATNIGSIVSPALVRQLAGALNAGNPVTNAVPGDDASYVGFTLEQIPERSAELNEVSKQLTEDYIATESLRLAREAAQAEYEKLVALAPEKRAEEMVALKGCKVEEFEASILQMPPEGFEYALAAVARIRPGEIAPVIETPNGAVIAELLKRIPADMKEFEEKKEQYAGFFRQRKEQMAQLAFEEQLDAQCHLLELQQ